MATFAEALRTARSGAGWSQQQLADAIHVSRTMIGHYESDAHPVIPPRERVLAIAKALDLTPLATDRLLAAAGYGAEYPVDPGELAGMLHLEEARITEAHVTHLVVDHLEGPPIASGGRPPGRADFYAYISLPPNYVTRAEVLAEIRAVVLGTVPAIALTSVIQGKPTALHGMGGIGKSVIARALCEDPEVQAAFPDGILWATLGQTPDLITRLREWIGALGGTVSEHAPTEGSLKATLADLFKERACLLILDDAWQRTHVEVFQVGGSRCRLLFTTRDAEIARELGARVQPIPLMTRGEAITLLEEWADGQLAEVASTLKAQIVERLGRLPLAVKLAGAQLQRKAADEWLRTFDARRLRLRRLEAIHDSLEATFGLSLDALDADTRRLYVALAIFKEDEPIHQAGIAKLWQALGGLDRDATADLLDDLAARALLEYRTMESTTGTSIRTAMSARHAGVVLHDLLREFIAAELGEGRRAAHQAILAAYRATCLGAGWHTAPDDRYLYDHLAYHLHAVGPADEFKALFADQDWMNVRIPQSAYTYDGYLADLDLAWAQADTEARRQIKAGQNLTAFADCVRYALIRTSVSSIATNYMPELVAQAVAVGLWAPERALSVAKQVPDAKQKARMYAVILGSGRLRELQRAAAQRLGLEAALALRDRTERAQALAALAPHLTGALIQRDLEAVRALRDKKDQALALAALAPYLPEKQRARVLQRILEAALALRDRAERAQALAALAPHLTGALLQRGLKVALSLRDKKDQALALAALAPYLPEKQRARVLQHALETALALRDKKNQAQALAALAPHLTGALLQRGLEAALMLENEGRQAAVLAALAPHLTGALFQHGLEAALALRGELAQVQALAALAPYLPEEQRARVLQHALEAALALRDGQAQVQALAALAPYLPGEQRARVLQRILEAALALRDGQAQVQALAALAPHLTGALLQRALEATLMLENEQDRVQALAALAPYLTDALLQRALEATLMLENEQDRVQALAALAPYLTDALLQRALEATLALLWDKWAQAQALAALAAHLPEEQRARVLQHGLEAALALRDQLAQARALAALAPRLTGALLQRALEAALALRDQLAQAWALAALAPHLPEEQRARVLQRALEAALTLENEQDRVQALAALAPHLPEEQRARVLQRALEAALALRDKKNQARALAALAPHLPEEQRAHVLQRALEAALALHDELAQAQVLTVLAPHLTGALFLRGLEAALALESEGRRAEVMAAFVPIRLEQAPVLASLRRALADHVLSLKDRHRWEVLAFCATNALFTPPILPPAALGAIAAHIGEICQEWHWL